MLEHRVIAGNPSHISHYCLVLHGLGDSMDGWAPIPPEMPVKGMAYILVQAPEPYGPGWSWFPIPGLTGPEDDEQAMREGVERSRRLLGELIEHLCTKFMISRRQLLLMGFSQGCMMVVDQALRSEQAFAGVVGISGGVRLLEDYPAAFGAALDEQCILMTHGRFDEMVDCSLASMEVERLREQGAPIELIHYDKGHHVLPEELGRIQDFLRERVQA